MACTSGGYVSGCSSPCAIMAKRCYQLWPNQHHQDICAEPTREHGACAYYPKCARNHNRALCTNFK
jgi:hypothetical protein